MCLSSKRWPEGKLSWVNVSALLTGRAQALLPVLGELARWGYDWAWSPPRSSESVDLGAIFRLAPGLVDPAALEGVVELTVGDEIAYTFTLCGDEVKLEERRAVRPDARVKGTGEAWVLAFAPDRDRSGLEIIGEYELAIVLLDGLAGARDRASGRAGAVA